MEGFSPSARSPAPPVFLSTPSEPGSVGTASRSPSENHRVIEYTRWRSCRGCDERPRPSLEVIEPPRLFPPRNELSMRCSILFLCEDRRSGSAIPSPSPQPMWTAITCWEWCAALTPTRSSESSSRSGSGSGRSSSWKGQRHLFCPAWEQHGPKERWRCGTSTSAPACSAISFGRSGHHWMGGPPGRPLPLRPFRMSCTVWDCRWPPWSLRWPAGGPWCSESIPRFYRSSHWHEKLGSMRWH